MTAEDEKKTKILKNHLQSSTTKVGKHKNSELDGGHTIISGKLGFLHQRQK